MAHLVPLLLQVAHTLCGIVLCGVFQQCLQLFDDGLLVCHVLLLLVALSRRGLVLLLEEMVAGCDETLPESLGILVGRGTDGLPFLLQLDEGVAGRTPFGAVLESLGLLYQGRLLGQVVVELRLDGLEVGRLLLEELVAGRTETLEDLGVHALGCIADGLPLGLQGDNLVCQRVPFGKTLEGGSVDGLYLLAESRLACQVLLFPGLEGEEMVLMALVDDRAGCLEAVPDVLTEVLGHGPRLLVFLMKSLELVEGTDDIRFVGQLLGHLAQARLGLQVLPEVIFPHLAVHLQQVVELLHAELVVLPQFGGILGGYGLYLLPLCLKAAEFIV